MKKATIILVAVSLLFSMAGCMSLNAEEANEATIGQVMYENTLYAISEETTAIAFQDEPLESAVIIPPGQSPVKNYECNLKASEILLYAQDNYLVIIADGTQYFIDR